MWLGTTLKQLKQGQRTHKPNELNLWLQHLSYVEYPQPNVQQPELTTGQNQITLYGQLTNQS